MRSILRRLFSSPEPIPVKRIGAARAVFESEEIQRIDITIEIPNGERIRLEMNPQLTHKLMRELQSAYLAINPPLRGYNGGVPFDGTM